MRQLRMSLFVLFILFLPRLASGQVIPLNPNNCNMAALPPGTFNWRVMAALPAGPRLTNQEQLSTYLARADFQRIASGTWGLTTAQVQSMQQAANANQWQEVLVPACTLFGRGMVFNTPAQVLNSPIFTNWSNWTAEDRLRAQQNGGRLNKRAWAFAVSPTKRIYCFEDCSNCLPEDIVPISINIAKSNDANRDGSFSNEEQAQAPGADVSFDLPFTNSSSVPVRVIELTDEFDGQTRALLPGVIGTVIPAGGQANWSYQLFGYSPAPGVRKINTVRITVEEAAKPGNVATDEATSVVTSALPVLRDLTIQKSVLNVTRGEPNFAESTTASPGDIARYRIVIASTGNASQTNVTVSDVLNSRLEFLSGEDVRGSGINLGTLSPNENRTFNYDVRVIGSAAAAITNTARVRGDEVPERTDIATVIVSSPPPVQAPAQIPPPPRTELIYLTCPDNQVRAFTTAGERFFGTWKPGGKLWQTLLSGAGTAAGSYFLSQPNTLRGRSVLFAIAAKWIVDIFNPSKDKVRVQVNGQEVGTFSEGQEVPIAGFPARMEWEGDRAQLIFNVEGREIGCDVDRTKDTINLVFSPETRIVKEIIKEIPVLVPTPVPPPLTPLEKGPGGLVPRPAVLSN